MTDEDHPASRALRSYGRVKGRALKPRQAELVEVLLPHLSLPEDGDLDIAELFSPPPCGEGVGGGGPTNSAATFARFSERPPSVAFGDTSPARGEEGAETILEIGFGAGEHLVAQAAAHPDARFIGVEPFLNGVAACLARIEDANVSNVRLHNGDARDVLARLPDASLDRVYILFPDPWPKKRHWKRRLIQPDFLAELARVLKVNGEVRFATDWKHYAAWTLGVFLKDPRFTWLAERADDWRKPWPGHVTTRYEEKKLGDTAPIYLRFRHKAPT